MSVKIFVYKKTGKLTPKKAVEIAAIMSIDELKKAKNYKKKSDKFFFILRRYLLRKIVSGFVGIAPEKLIFSVGKCGKPKLKYPVGKKIDFNISHSGNLIAIAVSESGKVGIDVEKMRKIDTRVARSYFSKQDLSYIASDKKNQKENFYKIWTLKESYIKAVGKGFSLPVKDSYSTFDKGGSINIGFGKKPTKNNWRFKTFDMRPGYKLAVCAQADKLPDSAIMINENLRIPNVFQKDE